MCNTTECPICMEIIDLCKNCSTTECGHKFHSNCLIKNIAFNGFECPYCRFEMFEETDDNEDEDEDDEEYRQGDEEEGNNEEGNNEEGDDEEGDDEEGDEDEDDDDEYDEYNGVVPSFELIQKKFIEKGITYECLIKSIMFSSMLYHKNENFSEYQKCNTFMEESYFDLITKYKPEEEQLNNANNNKLNFYFLEDEYSQRKYQKEMETELEKFLALDEDEYEIHNQNFHNSFNNNNNNDDENILNNIFLNNRFMEVI
jgi:Ring finger domain